MATSIGRKVRQLMKIAGMNQAKLAQSAGTTQATISRVLSGDVEDLKPETIKGLAEALSVTVDYLLRGTDKPGSQDISMTNPEVKELVGIFGNMPSDNKLDLLRYARYIQENIPQRQKRTFQRSSYTRKGRS